ncbi:MAG: V4R domain-containing protein, partial [Candidatus Hodarchaeales archaeon]
AGETEDFLTAKDKLKFANSLEIISKNMYKSILFNVVLRPGLGDYVHISVLQTALNGIKFADPFYSSLLYYAGMNYGKVSLDLGFQKIPEEPPEFEEGCKLIEDYFNDPTTILTRKQGKVKLEIVDEETARIKIYDCATASGISTFFTEAETFLCDFTAGFIDGRLTELLQEDVRVEETVCHGSIDPDHKGDKFCEFKITLD